MHGINSACIEENSLGHGSLSRINVSRNTYKVVLKIILNLTYQYFGFCLVNAATSCKNNKILKPEYSRKVCESEMQIIDFFYVAKKVLARFSFKTVGCRKLLIFSAT
jgi:hypothetical protein